RILRHGPAARPRRRRSPAPADARLRREGAQAPRPPAARPRDHLGHHPLRPRALNMTPSKTPAGLSEVLARDYGAVAATLAEAPRGFVAETFAVTAHDGRRYFVKWLPLWASTPALERGMAVAEQLRGLGLVEVINPV